LDAAEMREALSQALEPARERLMNTGTGDIAKSISGPIADWAETKEATLTEQKLQTG
jgi:hypothetical protein